jgi:hypothetical protein
VPCAGNRHYTLPRVAECRTDERQQAGADPRAFTFRFFGAANPDYRLFNLTRGVLKHRQIVIDRGDNGRANPQADAADALAIAITHCHVSQNAARMSDSKLVLTPDARRTQTPADRD